MYTNVKQCCVLVRNTDRMYKQSSREPTNNRRHCLAIRNFYSLSSLDSLLICYPRMRLNRLRCIFRSTVCVDAVCSIAIICCCMHIYLDVKITVEHHALPSCRCCCRRRRATHSPTTHTQSMRWCISGGKAYSVLIQLLSRVVV